MVRRWRGGGVCIITRTQSLGCGYQLSSRTFLFLFLALNRHQCVTQLHGPNSQSWHDAAASAAAAAALAFALQQGFGWCRLRQPDSKHLRIP